MFKKVNNNLNEYKKMNNEKKLLKIIIKKNSIFFQFTLIVLINCDFFFTMACFYLN